MKAESWTERKQAVYFPLLAPTVALSSKYKTLEKQKVGQETNSVMSPGIQGCMMSLPLPLKVWSLTPMVWNRVYQLSVLSFPAIWWYMVMISAFLPRTFCHGEAAFSLKKVASASRDHIYTSTQKRTFCIRRLVKVGSLKDLMWVWGGQSLFRCLMTKQELICQTTLDKNIFKKSKVFSKRQDKQAWIRN